MNPGKLDKRITIQKLTTITTPNNFDEEQWLDFKTVWASKNNLYGKEFYAAKNINEEKTINFQIRYSKELEGMNSKKYRIFHENKSYNITFIDNFQYQNKWLIIKALEVS